MAMTVRLIDWRDLPALSRYRRQCLFLDSTRLLTQGPRLVSAETLFSYLATATGIFTYLSTIDDDPDQKLIGQVTINNGASCARLSYLAPDSALESAAMPALLDHLTAEMGAIGAYNLLAEVDEKLDAFEALRKAGFAIYARQRIWQLNGGPKGEVCNTPWKSGVSRDALAVRNLFCNLVPGLVQQVEPPPARRVPGQVYRQDGEIFGYVELHYGPRGIWAQPFIHPDADQISARLACLFLNLPFRNGRPVYFCVRSYQSWLELALEDLGAQPGPQQAVMVKRLTVLQKAVKPYALPVLEGGQPEISAPFTQAKN